MKPSKCVRCKKFPCADVNSDCYRVPDIEVDTEKVRIVLISEAAPQKKSDYY
jgi:hypothetical protein